MLFTQNIEAKNELKQLNPMTFHGLRSSKNMDSCCVCTGTGSAGFSLDGALSAIEQTKHALIGTLSSIEEER